jgi:Rrf2 family protein
VNLSLSRRGSYVVRAAICLAAAHESAQLCTLRQVSEEMRVPRTFVPQILSDLVRSGLAVSTAGLHGGYRLARPPAEVRLLEVVEAGEGTLVFSGCVRGIHPCTGRTVCPLHETWTEASARLWSALASTTLAELVGRDPEVGTGSRVERPTPKRRATRGAAEVPDPAAACSSKTPSKRRSSSWSGASGRLRGGAVLAAAGPATASATTSATT